MKLKLIISGGETGADITGLEEARKLGIPTGGFVWKGFTDELGINLDLRDVYGLRETKGNRTELNAAVADCTLWFGYDPRTTGGGQNTYYSCKKWGRPMFINPGRKMMVKVANEFEVINIAGNRESINSRVVQKVRDAFSALAPFFEVNRGTEGTSTEVRHDRQGEHQGPGGAFQDRRMYRQG